MISVRKTSLAAALMLSVGAGAADAYPIVSYIFQGTFTMYTPYGDYWGGDPAVTGSMTMDMGTGMGSAEINFSTPFSGYMWTAHTITLTAMATPGVIQANMLFDWNGNLNIPVVVDFSMTPTGPGTFSIATLDGGYGCSTDGVLGCPMASGPFPGFSNAFGGIAYVYNDLWVPVPSAVWLFGPGLLGLVGVAIEKRLPKHKQ